MTIFYIALFLLGAAFLKDILWPAPVEEEQFEIVEVNGEEVTVEDMILHDMNNNDDTYDIGVIDFND